MSIVEIPGYVKAIGAGAVLALMPLESDAQNIIYTSHTHQHEPQYKTRIAKPPRGYMNEIWNSFNLENGTDINLDSKYSHYVWELPLKLDFQLSGKSRTWETPKEGAFIGAKLGGGEEENMFNLARGSENGLKAYFWGGPEFYRHNYLGLALYTTVEKGKWFSDIVLKHEKNLYSDGPDEKPQINAEKDLTAYISIGNRVLENIDVGASTTISKPRAIEHGRRMDDVYRIGDVYVYGSLIFDGGNVMLKIGKNPDMDGFDSYRFMVGYATQLYTKDSEPLREIANVFIPNPRMDNLDEISPRRRARRERIRDRYYEKMEKRRFKESMRKEKGKGSYHRKGN